MTLMRHNETKIKTTPNRGFALWGLTFFVETFVQDSTFVLRMNGSAKNPPQRKAAKHYQRCRKLNEAELLIIKYNEHEN
jgi:hypothetical protein